MKIAILLVLLAFPASADARHHHRAHTAAVRLNPVPAALNIAFHYWHAYPCGGDFRVVNTTPPANDEAVPAGLRAAMWSSWNSDIGPNQEGGQQPFSHCVIGVNSNVWTTERFAAFTAWPEFSIDMIHEVGHLLGHNHTADPADVMLPEPNPKQWITGEYAPGWN